MMVCVAMVMVCVAMVMVHVVPVGVCALMLAPYLRLYHHLISDCSCQGGAHQASVSAWTPPVQLNKLYYEMWWRCGYEGGVAMKEVQLCGGSVAMITWGCFSFTVLSSPDGKHASSVSLKMKDKVPDGKHASYVSLKIRYQMVNMPVMCRMIYQDEGTG